MAATHLDPLALMTKLISFPTVSRDSNLPLVDWVESYLDSHGIPAHRVYDETGEKAALAVINLCSGCMCTLVPR